jgi:hypothetical protein
MPTRRASDHKYAALRDPALLYQFIHLLFENLLNTLGIDYPIFHFATPFLVCNRATLLLPQCEKRFYKAKWHEVEGVAGHLLYCE